MASQTTKTTQSRVFLTSSRGAPNVRPEFQGCLVLGSISQSFGDREAILCQDPYKIGKFVTVGFTESPEEAVESSMSGRLAPDVRSGLITRARAQAPVDVHVHVGALGTNPSVFSNYQMKIVFENARFSQVEIDELGAHDEDTPINENVDFTADAWYQLVSLVFSERATSLTAKEILSIYAHYNGNLEKPPRERYVLVASSIAAGGSLSTPPDLLYSLDEGTNWFAFDIDSATSSDTGDCIAVVGEYVVVGSKSTDSFHYVLLSALDGVTVPDFTEVDTGFVATKGPADIYSLGSIGFIAAEGGYVYKTTNPAAGVEVMSAGTATTQDLNAIAAYDETTIVAVGNSNAVLVCLDGDNFSAVTGPAAGVNLTAVSVLSPSIFLVGTANGKLFYTTNAGLSWTEKSFPSSGSGAVRDIKFATNLVGYMTHDVSNTAYLLSTTDAGYSWSRTPTAGLGTYSRRLNAIGVVRGEPNLVALAGLADDGTAGTIIVGEPIS